MHRVGAHPHRKLDQLSLVQIALRRRRGRVIGLIRLAQCFAPRSASEYTAMLVTQPRGARNAADDLAAVRDQETFECLGCHGALTSGRCRIAWPRRLEPRGREREAQGAPRIGGIEHPVVQRRGCVERMSCRSNCSRIGAFSRSSSSPESSPPRISASRLMCQHARRLFAAHHGGARVRPLEQQPRRKRGRTCVIAGAEASADDHGVFRHRRARTAVTSFAPSLAMPPASAPVPHESGNILQKHQRMPSRSTAR